MKSLHRETSLVLGNNLEGWEGDGGSEGWDINTIIADSGCVAETNATL